VKSPSSYSKIALRPSSLAFLPGSCCWLPETQHLDRVEPRRNTKVNRSWICDEGRWGYRYVDDEKRIKLPKRNSDKGFVELSWNHAFGQLSQVDKESVLVALSPSMTNEEIADTVQTFSELGISKFCWVVEESEVGKKEPYDGILKHSDKTPNVEGFQRVMKALNTKFFEYAGVKKQLDSESINWIWFLGLEGQDPPGLKLFMQMVPKGTQLMFHATTEVPFFEMASLVLPNVTAYEKAGTMVNALGRLQKLKQAIPIQDMARDAHAVAFGIKSGSDREPIPEGRSLHIFDSVIKEKVLKMDFQWKDINPRGVPLSG